MRNRAAYWEAQGNSSKAVNCLDNKWILRANYLGAYRSNISDNLIARSRGQAGDVIDEIEGGANTDGGNAMRRAGHNSETIAGEIAVGSLNGAIETVDTLRPAPDRVPGDLAAGGGAIVDGASNGDVAMVATGAGLSALALLEIFDFVPGADDVLQKTLRNAAECNTYIRQAAEARQKTDRLINFSPKTPGRSPGHARSKHGWDVDHPTIMDTRNNPEEIYVGVNKNGNTVTVFYKDGNAVITDGADSTSVITAYGADAPIRPSAVNSSKWANDPNFHLVD
jgi:hypothetical protein